MYFPGMPPANPLLSKPLSEANDAIVRAFTRSLRAEGRSVRTVQSYEEAARLLAGFLDDVPLDEVTKTDVEKFMIFVQEHWSQATAAVRYRSLQALFKWLLAEAYVEKSPMTGTSAPKATSKPVPVSSDGDLKALLTVCKGTDIYSHRDTAIVRLLIDTGMRVSELTGLAVVDLDMRTDSVTVHGKGDKIRILPFGAKTGQALERYLRARAKHPLARTPDGRSVAPGSPLRALWVGKRGQALTPSGVTQMLERRCEEAGISKINPHKFRHTAAHVLMASGAGDSDAMRLFGWSSRDMLQRYGASAADERARETHRRLSPGDRI